jgi:hypothetical protein
LLAIEAPDTTTFPAVFIVTPLRLCWNQGYRQRCGRQDPEILAFAFAIAGDIYQNTKSVIAQHSIRT